MNDERTGGISGFGIGESGAAGTSGTVNEPVGGGFDNPAGGLGGGEDSSAMEAGLTSAVVALLEKMGVQQDQINTVKEALQNANIDESLEKAKEQVTETFGKARDYAKQNPKAVIAGLAVVAIGAGLITAAAKRNK
jgi:hypothetical protein